MKIYLTLILIMVLNPSFAKKNKIIDFNTKKGINDDEGLIVLVMDINFRIAKVSLAKEGKVFPVYSIKKPNKGRTIRIIKAKEGKYYWKEGIGYSGATTYTFNMEKEHSIFEVKAGKINYPGSLEIVGWREKEEIYFNYDIVNKSTAILEEIKSKYPDLIQQYPMTYSGKNPDPFLDYQEEISDENKQ